MYTNGRYQNDSPGLSERDPGLQGDPLGQNYQDFDDDEKNKTGEEEPRLRGKRGRLVGVVLFLLLLSFVGTGIWLMFGGNKTKINVPVRDNAQKSDQARSNDDVTAEAIAEVRGATASPTPGLSASPVPATPAAGAGTIIVPTTPVTVPMEGVGGTVSPATDAATRDVGGVKREELVSQRNSERSIRCAPIPAAVPANKPIAGAIAKELLPEPAIFKRTEPRIVLPSFGAMLPVRTLGALYTLRPSLIRFELVRDLRGENWQLKKGTIIVGQQQGSEYDRAYVSPMGFIDPETKRFVKLTGEVLGSDGAQGLKGKRRRISSRWASVLSRTIPVATALGQAALSRGNSTTIVLPGAVAPELTSNFAAINRREFIEVPAGTPGFLLITNLPKEVKGIDAETVAENVNGSGALTDEELAALLESGSPEQIRAAMPRMSPELRQIAEMVLKEPGK
jgi:hypothetical protein